MWSVLSISCIDQIETKIINNDFNTNNLRMPTIICDFFLNEWTFADISVSQSPNISTNLKS
jgi:hypothetical protein